MFLTYSFHIQAIRRGNLYTSNIQRFNTRRDITHPPQTFPSGLPFPPPPLPPRPHPAARLNPLPQRWNRPHHHRHPSYPV